MGRMFLKLVRSEFPGLGIGVQTACFQLLGKCLYGSRLSKMSGRRLGRAVATCLSN